MKITLSLLLFALASIHTARACTCSNGEAQVELSSQHVQDLSSRLMLVSSFPYSVRVITSGSGNSTLGIGATMNTPVLSFQVATRLYEHIQDKMGEWGVKSIKASECFSSPDSLSNIGTIGH